MSEMQGVMPEPPAKKLKDVTWTRDELGRLAWIYEGEMYTKVHTPPMLHNLESTPELMIAEIVIRAQGGSLSVTSTDGEETVIVIDLPAP